MKAAMSGQKIPLLDRLRSSWNILRAYRNGTFADVPTKVRHHRRLTALLKERTGLDPGDARVLDLGCGQMATETALFAAEGARVVGVDIEVPTFRMSARHFLAVARTNGVERALKSLARHVVFDRRFFAGLEQELGRPIPLGRLDVRIMDANRLDFPDDHFDFVHSAWSFEHIADVPASIREIDRVLKPGGIAWIGVHLFPSLSGGHHLDWVAGESDDTSVPPWDHLRENRFPVNTYLNRLSLADYREILAGEARVLHEELVREGEKYLTPDLESALGAKGYSREDLLTRALVVVCGKRENGTI